MTKKRKQSLIYIALTITALPVSIFVFRSSFLLLAENVVMKLSGMEVIGKFVTPVKHQIILYLKTNNGKVVANKRIFDVYGSITYEQALKDAQSSLFDDVFVLSDYVVYADNKNLNIFDRVTKSIYSLKLPDKVRQKWNTSSYFTFNVDELNTQKLLLTFAGDYSVIGTYVYDTKTHNFEDITHSTGNCGVYCGGLRLAAVISPDEYYLREDAGDACWGMGDVYIFRMISKTLTKLFSYDIGCTGNKDAFVGIADNKIIGSQDRYTVDKDSAVTGKSTIYTNLFALDKNGQREELLTSVSMPKNIRNMKISNDGKLIYMASDVSPNNNSNYYVYDVKLHQIKQSEVNLSNKFMWESSHDYETLMNSNKDLFEVETSNSRITKILNPESWNTGIRFTDSDGDVLYLIHLGDLAKIVPIADHTQIKDLKSLTESSVEFTANGVHYAISASMGEVFKLK